MEFEEKDALWKLLKAFSWSNQKVNRDFGAQDSKIEALEVKDNDIPELRPRNRKVNFRPGKSTEVNGPTWSTPRSTPKASHKDSCKTFPHPLGELIWLVEAYWWWVGIQIQKGDKAFNAYAILCPLAFSLHLLSPNGPKSDLPMLYTHSHFALNVHTLP